MLLALMSIVYTPSILTPFDRFLTTAASAELILHNYSPHSLFLAAELVAVTCTA